MDSMIDYLKYLDNLHVSNDYVSDIFSIVQFRKVKARQTDNSRDSRQNRDADKLADQGRLMDLAEAISTPLFRYPSDCDDVSNTPASPAACQVRVPRSTLRPGSEQSASVAVHYNQPVTPMHTATQYDTTHPVCPL